MKKIAKTTHLQNLTDKFGVWQFFENGHILRSEGYALDDSARALIVFLLYKQPEYAGICLEYIERSLRKGNFVGFWDENHNELVYPSSEDAHALAVWALAYAINQDFEKQKAKNILNLVNLARIEESPYIRTNCYALIAHTLLGNQDKAHALYTKIINKFDAKLNWFENTLTYANAIIPYALLSFHQKFEAPTKEQAEIIIKSIETLEIYCRIEGIPSPVGSDSWQKIGDTTRCLYGQQPIDAAFMVLVMVKAYQVLHDEKYKKAADEWIQWFYGNNIVHANLINEDFACADWIKAEGISTNFGSESTLVYLWAQEIYNTM